MPFFSSTRDFFVERMQWLDVRVMPAVEGGYDVVLRIDGSYGDKADAEAMREYLAAEIRSMCQREGILQE